MTTNNENINILPDDLNNIVVALNKDNKNIYDGINKIISIISSLDDSVWKSPEKNNIVNNFIPFVKNRNAYLYNNLSNSSNLLEKAMIAYVEADNTIREASSKLG